MEVSRLYISRWQILSYLSLRMAVLASTLPLKLLVNLRAAEVLVEIRPGKLEALNCAAVGDAAQPAYRPEDLVRRIRRQYNTHMEAA